MTLPSSGQISMSQVNVELAKSATATISLNDSDVRSLAGVPSGAISMSNLWGKGDVGVNWTNTGVSGFNGYGVMTNGSGTWGVSTDTGYVVYSTNNGTAWTTTYRPTTSALWGADYLSGGYLTNVNAGTSILRSTSISSGFASVYTAAEILRNSMSHDGYYIQGANDGVTYATLNGTSYTAQPAIGANSAFIGMYVASLGRTIALGVGNQSKYRNGVPSSVAWTGSCTGLSGTIYSVAWSPTLSIAVCGTYDTGALYYSSNLISWTAATNPSGQGIFGMCWADDKFIAVGANGAIVTSTNGTSWTSRTSGTTATLRDVAFAGQVAIAAGDGVILRSI